MTPFTIHAHIQFAWNFNLPSWSMKTTKTTFFVVFRANLKMIKFVAYYAVCRQAEIDWKKKVSTRLEAIVQSMLTAKSVGYLEIALICKASPTLYVNNKHVHLRSTTVYWTLASLTLRNQSIARLCLICKMTCNFSTVSLQITPRFASR